MDLPLDTGRQLLPVTDKITLSNLGCQLEILRASTVLNPCPFD